MSCAWETESTKLEEAIDTAVRCRTAGKFELAKQLLVVSLSEAKKARFTALAIDCLMELALVSGMLGKHSDVIRYCDEGLALVPAKISLEAGRLLRCKSSGLSHTGNHTRALSVGEESMAVFEKLSGRTLEYAKSQLDYGECLMRKGDPKGALEQIDEALPLLPSGSDFLSSALDTKAQLLEGLGRLQEAVIVYEMVMEQVRARDGDKHPNYASVCNNAAPIYARLKQMDRAVELQRVANSIAESTFGPQHPYCQSGRQSLSMYEQALHDSELKNALATTKHRM